MKGRQKELVSCSDGGLAVPLGRHAKEKLNWLNRYLTTFNIGMKNLWTDRIYIDLLSGPGKCLIGGKEEDGSPLLAFKCKTPFTQYFFNDINPECIESIKNRIGDDSRVAYLNLDCNEAVGKIIPQLPPFSLGFCFIDPYNCEIEFDSIRKLTEGRRIDLIITFHLGNMRRGRLTNKLEKFFPPNINLDNLRREACSGSYINGDKIMKAYIGGLNNIEYKNTEVSAGIRNSTGVVLYHLVFASKHKLGQKFFQISTQKSASGQLTLPWPDNHEYK